MVGSHKLELMFTDSNSNQVRGTSSEAASVGFVARSVMTLLDVLKDQLPADGQLNQLRRNCRLGDDADLPIGEWCDASCMRLRLC